MNERLKSIGRWFASMGGAAIIGSAAGGFWAFWLNDYQDKLSKVREAHYTQEQKKHDLQSETIKKFFAEDGDPVREAARNYVNFVSENIYGKPVTKEQRKAATELTDQVYKRVDQAGALKTIFPSPSADAEIKAYQEALLAFAESIENFENPMQLRAWTRKLSDMGKAKDALREKLVTINNTKPPQPNVKVSVF